MKIRPDEGSGEAPLLPRLERFRPRGSTEEVLFRTSRPSKQTIKSHVSHVVLDTKTWERSVAFRLEQSDLVESYVHNDHPFLFPGCILVQEKELVDGVF